MYYINKNSKITLEWQVMKGIGNVEEDFSGSTVSLFLRGAEDKFAIACEADENGLVKATIDEGLHEGVYGLDLVWVKNDQHIGDTRCVMRTRKACVFGINTTAEVGATPVKVRMKTTASSYGYDGLNAWEMSVMRGKTTLSEDEWLEKLNACTCGEVQPAVTLSPTSFSNVSYGGATLTVTATCVGGATLTSVSCTASHITATLNGSTITIAVAANTGVARTAVVTLKTSVGDKAINITQAAKPADIVTYPVYAGSSAAAPTEVLTSTQAGTVRQGVSTTVQVVTTPTDKKKCHWMAISKNLTSNVTAKDIDNDGIDLQSTVIGDYKVYYFVSSAYISNTTKFTVSI